MIIGVLSDTHRNMNSVDRAFSIFKNKGATVVFHLGDKIDDVFGKGEEYDMEIVAVSGNMDFRPDMEREVVYEGDGVKFLLTHGHYHDVRTTHYHLIERAKELGCKVALYGHTHMPFNNREKGVLVLNPGSAAEPRGGSKKSCAIIETTSTGINAEVILL